ncbi:MAG: c-type cytochrome [Aquabacterium sp.]
MHLQHPSSPLTVRLMAGCIVALACSTAAHAQTKATTPATGAAPAATDDTAIHKILQERGCLACHAVDKKMVGPAYKDVAAKYKGQKDAIDKLVTKVMKGGSGVWGAIPMPPQAVSDKEAHQLVQWILSQK